MQQVCNVYVSFLHSSFKIVQRFCQHFLSYTAATPILPRPLMYKKQLLHVTLHHKQSSPPSSSSSTGMAFITLANSSSCCVLNDSSSSTNSLGTAQNISDAQTLVLDCLLLALHVGF